MELDDKYIKDLTGSFVLAYAITIVAVAFTAPVHEFLHVLGAWMAGGSVKSVVLFNPSNWFAAYIHPIVATSGELGSVVASIPDTGTARFLYYFLPYIVLFPLSVVLMLGEDLGDFTGGDGISNKWRFVGGPVFISSFAAFWTDYSLYLGKSGNAVVPVPAIVYQMLYLGFIVAGVVGSTVYLEYFRDQ